MGLISSPDNGATERPDSSNESIMVFLAGPIRYWWKSGVENTRIHKLYTAKRDQIFYALSEDFLVYAPHRAVRGPWDNRAQLINDMAVSRSDAFVNLNAGVPMDGTKQERTIATTLKIPTFEMFIGDRYNVDEQINRMKTNLVQVTRRK